MKILYVIRGLPGAGKSTLARHIIRSLKKTGQDCVWAEADHYFINSTGEYKFRGADLPAAHLFCQRVVLKAMKEGLENVIVSNTFTKKSEVEVYVKLAAQHGYSVQLLTASNKCFESEHDVPEETLKRMAQRWEHFNITDF